MRPPFQPEQKRLQIGDGVIRESISGEQDPLGQEKDALEVRIMRTLYQYWQEQQDRIIETVKPAIPDARKATAAEIARRLDAGFWSAEERELLAILLPLLTEGAEGGVKLQSEQVEAIGVGVDWTMPYTQAGTWARSYGADLVRGVTSTTKDRMRQTIGSWYDQEQARLPDLVGALRDNYGFSQGRAKLIAITETTRAYAQGEMIAGEEVERQGLFDYQKTWQTANDDRVCPICQPLHNQTVKGVRESFGAYGLNQEGPPAHPGCRCWVVTQPVVGEVEEGEDRLRGFEGDAHFSDIGGATARAMHDGDIAVNREVWQQLSAEDRRFTLGHEIAHNTVEEYVLANNDEWNLAEEALLLREGVGRSGVPYKLFVGGEMRIGEAIADAISMYLNDTWPSTEGLPTEVRGRVTTWAQAVIPRAGYSEMRLRADIKRLLKQLL